jgi:hypothetical protein
MIADAASCPFCNAPLPPLAGAPSTEKLPCPRCGELVPAGCWRVDAAATGIRAGQAGKPDLRQEGKADNRKTALIMICIMLMMATIGLFYALWTLRDRQARHPWMPKKLEPIAFRRPLDLAGLGYLPKDCKLVAGLQVAEMMQDEKVGKKLLAAPRPTLLDWPLKQIARTSGVTVEEIDHIVLGSADLTRLVMVVKARGKISLEKIADARPVRSSKQEDRPVYEFAMLPPIGNALVWCVDDETLVYALPAENLNGLSVQPRAVKEAISGPFHEVLAQRLPKQNYVWAAGRVDQLGPAAVFLPLIVKADVGFLKETKTIALGLTPLEGLTLIGHFHMTDAKAAAKLKARLDDTKIEGATSQKTETTPADQPQHWVSWQVRGDTATLRAWLGEGKEAK